jgi:NADH-quinone oxidoreductase subunit F
MSSTSSTKVDMNRAHKDYCQALKREKIRVAVCAGLGCIVNGALELYDALEAEIKAKGIYADLCYLLEDESNSGCSVVKTGCQGFCEAGALMRIEPAGLVYIHVKPEDAAEIVERTLLKGEIIERLAYKAPHSDKAVAERNEIPFYSGQKQIVLRNCGIIDPSDIRDYIAHDGYLALQKALKEMSRDEVISTVIDSGLRGRGGAGFPAGRKWAFAKAEESDTKYMVCNADEGDPGAFMDRSVLEGDPHSVIEAMAIAGYAIGANHGYIYVRAEYPLAVARLKHALKEARDNGLLGNDILGSGFDFDIKIKEGAGAFVCGEESALLASIEGKRGMPRPKPPFPAQKGLWGYPTVINNVETLASVPLVILRGAEWFSSCGVGRSTGTKTFALSGKVRNTGLVEVPMGTTLRDMIFKIGGGIRGDKRFKAVQIGGPSGGCLTEEHLDLTLDYDSLAKVGAIIGSGGLVVMDEDTCMVEMARIFMHFTQSESCGKCVPCREGTKRMLEILEKIVAGKGTMEDLELLDEVAQMVKDASLCGLGKTAPNPVLTMIKYFRDEYLAHVVDKRCPAGQCQAFKSYYIDPELCKGCGKCSRGCPAKAISGKPREAYSIDTEACLKCGACVEMCPFGAISKGDGTKSKEDNGRDG